MKIGGKDSLIPGVSTHFRPMVVSEGLTVGRIYKIEKWEKSPSSRGYFIHLRDDRGGPKIWWTLISGSVKERDASFEANLENILKE